MIFVSFSGGMDSATILARALDLHSNKEVRAVGFTYGSKHNFWENEAAKRVAVRYAVDFQLVDLFPIMQSFQSDLLKTGGDIPEGHYAADSMTRTVVPGRNIIFAAILTGLAWGPNEIWLGIHAGDHAIYPDCRPEFFDHMRQAIYFGSDSKVKLKAPYLFATKKDIVRDGLLLKVPYHLTRTCYKNQAIACGKCGSCQERLEAFELNGIVDPIEYESRELLPK